MNRESDDEEFARKAEIVQSQSFLTHLLSFCPGAGIGRPSTNRSTLKNLESSDLSTRCGWSSTQPRCPK